MDIKKFSLPPLHVLHTLHVDPARREEVGGLPHDPEGVHPLVLVPDPPDGDPADPPGLERAVAAAPEVRQGLAVLEPVGLQA